MRTIRSFRVAVIFALATSFSCATSGPLRRPAQPIAVANIVAPLTPNDPALLIYLRVRDVWALLGKLGVQAMVSGAAPGFRFADLRAGGIASAFAWDPPAGKSVDHSPAYLVLPTATTTPLAQQLQLLLGPLTPLGNSSAFSVNPKAQAVAVDPKDLARLTEQPLGDDVQLFYNVESFLQRHRAEVDKWIETTLPSLMKSQQSAGASGKMLVGSMRAYMELFEKLKSLAINFSVDAERYEISVVTQSKVANAPRTSTDLSRFVDDGDLDLRYESSSDTYGMTWYVQFYQSLFADADAIVKAKLDEMLKAQVDALSGSHIAVSFHFADGKAHGMFVSQLLPGKNAMAPMRQSVLMSNDPAMQQLYANLGSKASMSVKATPAIRKTLGYTIDHYDFSQHAVSGLPPSKDDAVPVIKAWSAELVQVGPYFIYALNETPAALDRVITALVNGVPLRPAPVGGADFFLDGKVNIARSINLAVSALPKFAGTVSKLDEALPAITFDGAEVGPITRYRVRVPRQVATAIGAWASQAFASVRAAQMPVPIEPAGEAAPIKPAPKKPHQK